MKINDFEDQIPDHSVYITTNDFSKYNTNDIVNEKIKRKLATKYDIADFIKKTVFDEKLQILMYFIMYFTGDNGYQTFLVLAPILNSQTLETI